MIRNADTRAARQRSQEQIPAQDHSSYHSPRLCTALPRGFRARRNRHRAKYKGPHAGADSLKGLRCPIRRTLGTQGNTVTKTEAAANAMDLLFELSHPEVSSFWAKQTSLIRSLMSANDLKRISPVH